MHTQPQVESGQGRLTGNKDLIKDLQRQGASLMAVIGEDCFKGDGSKCKGSKAQST